MTSTSKRAVDDDLVEMFITGLYWDLYNDYQELLGDDPHTLMFSALNKTQRQFPVFAVVNACDSILEEKIARVVRRYSKTGKLPKLPKYIKWHLGVRIMLAASVLYPYRKGQLPKDGVFRRLLEDSAPTKIVQMLLLEFVPIYYSVLSDYFMFDLDCPHDSGAPLLVPVSAKRKVRAEGCVEREQGGKLNER